MFGSSTLEATRKKMTSLVAGARSWPARPPRLAALLMAGTAIVGTAQLLPWRIGVVRGNSMSPTFEPGDLFVYSQPLLSAGPLRRGDVIVLRHHGETWIKRVYATGGERFWTYYEDDGENRYHLPIRAAERDRFDRLAARVRSGKATRAQVYQLKMPPGTLFVLGDDTAVSQDSRTLGVFNADEVVGRVVAAPGRRFDQAPLRQELSWLTPTPRPAAATKPRKVRPQQLTAPV